MPEPRDYAADPSCSSRCLYCRVISRSPRRHPTGGNRHDCPLPSAGGAHSRPGSGDRQAGAGTPAPRFRRYCDRDRRLELCNAARLPHHGLRWLDDSPGRCQHRRRFLVERAGARCGSFAHARRNPTPAGARRNLSPRSSDPHLAALVYAGVLPRGDLVFYVLAAAAFSASHAARRRAAATAGSVVPNRTAYGRPLPAATTRRARQCHLRVVAVSSSLVAAEFPRQRLCRRQ